MKLENFEKEYQNEINILKEMRFKTDITGKTFNFPFTYFIKKSYALYLSVPALAAFLLFFTFGTNQNVNSKELALLEESNNRILKEIDATLYEEGK